MGLPTIKSLHDLSRLNADLKVTCEACRHVGVFSPTTISAYFLNRDWNCAWEVIAMRFRCRECGSKRVCCGIAPTATRIALPKPEPTWREVKEHIRRKR